MIEQNSSVSIIIEVVYLFIYLFLFSMQIKVIVPTPTNFLCKNNVYTLLICNCRFDFTIFPVIKINKSLKPLCWKI